MQWPRCWRRRQPRLRSRRRLPSVSPRRPRGSDGGGDGAYPRATRIQLPGGLPPPRPCRDAGALLQGPELLPQLALAGVHAAEVAGCHFEGGAAVKAGLRKDRGHLGFRRSGWDPRQTRQRGAAPLRREDAGCRGLTHVSPVCPRGSPSCAPSHAGIRRCATGGSGRKRPVVAGGGRGGGPPRRCGPVPRLPV